MLLDASHVPSQQMTSRLLVGDFASVIVEERDDVDVDAVRAGQEDTAGVL